MKTLDFMNERNDEIFDCNTLCDVKEIVVKWRV